MTWCLGQGLLASVVGLGATQNFGAALRCGALVGAYFAVQLVGWKLQLAAGVPLVFPWVAKVAAAAAVLAVCATGRFGAPSLSEIGALRLPGRSAWPAMLAAILVAVFAAQWDPSLPSRAGLERTLFEALIPGLDEELFLRGWLLAELAPRRDRARSSQLRAAIATVVIFVTAHVLTFGPNGTPALDLQPASVLSLAVIGIACTGARMRSGSVWAAVLVHNLANLSLVLFARDG